MASGSTPPNVVLHMTRKRSCRGLQHSYQLSGHNSTSVTEVSYLGVAVTVQLPWATHFEELCAKGNRVFDLVKRVCGQDISDVPTRKLLYTSLVRPILEYTSCLWSPYSVKHSSLLENIQRRATKVILYYPPVEVDYKNGLEQLEFSCLSSRLVLLLQILILFWFPQFLSSVLEITTLQIYVFWILPSFHNHDNQKRITKSYFPRTVMPWGSLHHSIKYATSSQQFKNFLHAHYETRLSVYRPP